MAGQITNSLIEAMQIMLDDDLKMTYDCTVVKCLDGVTGEYELDYMSNKTTAFSLDPSRTYSPKDLVMVIAPKGDFNDVKYILGLSNPKSGGGTPEDERFYVTLTDDLLDKDKDTDVFGLKSYISNDYENLDLYYEENITSKVCNDSTFIERISKYLNGTEDVYLRFKVKIKTSLDDEQIFSDGHYGIKLSIPFVNKGYIDYTFDSNYMVGSPKTFTQWSDQVFDIAISQHLIYNKALPPIITIYKDNFFINKEKLKVDIEFNKVELYIMRILTPEELANYKVILNATKGAYFLRQDTIYTTKEITAQLLSRGIVVNDEVLKDDDMYWFEEDATIDSNSLEYFEIGGPGWKCLNPYTIDEETGKANFESRLEKIQITAKDVVGSKKYKCLIKHNEAFLDGEITIVNETDSYDLTLEATNGPNISIYQTEVELKLKFFYRGLTEKLDNLEKLCYTWSKIEYDGTEDFDFPSKLFVVRKNELSNIDGKGYCITTVVFPAELIQKDATIKCGLYLDGAVPGIKEFETDEKHHIGVAEIKLTIVDDDDESLRNIRESIPRVLKDYNMNKLTVKQDFIIVGEIDCYIKSSTDLQGHLLLHFDSTEYCNVILKFIDNEVTELYAPITYTVQPGENSIGVPHAYLNRQSGVHSFIVMMQCTNGTITIPVRGSLFTIDGRYIDLRLLNAGLDVSDLSLRQLRAEEGIDQIWAIGTDNNTTYLKSKKYKGLSEDSWTPQYNFENTFTAAVEFKGKWIQNKDFSYTLVTESWPIVAIVDIKNNLSMWHYNQKDKKYEKLIDMDTDVVSVSMCMGFSSTIYIEQDQGIVCAYAKKDGTAWYTNYAYNAALEKVAWNPPQKLENLEKVTHVSVNRLNDYRIGIVCSAESYNKWFISKRTYVGQAVPSEFVNIKDITFIRPPLFYMGDKERKTTAVQLQLPESVEKAPNLLYGTYEGNVVFYPDIDPYDLVTVYINGAIVGRDIYDLYNEEGKFGIQIKVDTQGMKTIQIIFDNSKWDAYLDVTGEGHGWYADSYNFTWKPVMVYRIEPQIEKEPVRIVDITGEGKIIYKPIITKYYNSSDNAVMKIIGQGVITNKQISQKDYKNIESTLMNINSINLNIKMEQTGEQPI